MGEGHVSAKSCRLGSQLVEDGAGDGMGAMVMMATVGW